MDTVIASTAAHWRDWLASFATTADEVWLVLRHKDSDAPDLVERLDRDPAARANFDRFPPSSKRLILSWIATARRPETRGRRIEQTATLAAVGLRANYPTSRRQG